jgi:hypothetical protein
LMPAGGLRAAGREGRKGELRADIIEANNRIVAGEGIHKESARRRRGRRDGQRSIFSAMAGPRAVHAAARHVAAKRMRP